MGEKTIMMSKEEIDLLKNQHPGDVVCAVLNHVCENNRDEYGQLIKILNQKGTSLTRVLESAVGGRFLPETSGCSENAFLGFTWDNRGAAGS